MVSSELHFTRIFRPIRSLQITCHKDTSEPKMLCFVGSDCKVHSLEPIKNIQRRGSNQLDMMV